MRRNLLIVTSLLLCVASLSGAEPLSEREQSLVKTIIAQSFRMRIHLWKQQSPDKAEADASEHPLALALSNTQGKEQKLLHMFKTLPKPQKLLPAQALAYIGNNTGISVLREATVPTKVMSPYLTNSGFEMSESALCLLYLNFEFPKTFRFSRLPNALYPDLDKLLEK